MLQLNSHSRPCYKQYLYALLWLRVLYARSLKRAYTPYTPFWVIARAQCAVSKRAYTPFSLNAENSMSTSPGITLVIHMTLCKVLYHIKRQDSVIPSMYLYWDIYNTASYNTSSKNLETLNAFYSKSTFRRRIAIRLFGRSSTISSIVLLWYLGFCDTI